MASLATAVVAARSCMASDRRRSSFRGNATFQRLALGSWPGGSAVARRGGAGHSRIPRAKQWPARPTAVVRLVGERTSRPADAGRSPRPCSDVGGRRAGAPSRDTSTMLAAGAARAGPGKARSTVRGCSLGCSATHTLTPRRWTRSSALRTPAESRSLVARGHGRGRPGPGARGTADARALHCGAGGQSRLRRDSACRYSPPGSLSSGEPLPPRSAERAAASSTARPVPAQCVQRAASSLSEEP
jgi:hypothetical protein